MQHSFLARRCSDLVRAAKSLGFLFVVIVSMTLGPVTRTLRRGLLRHAALAGVAVLGAGIMVWLPGIGLGRFDLRAVLIVALSVWVTGGVTLALEALAGLPGLAPAGVLFPLEALPLPIGHDARLFPEPWRTLGPLSSEERRVGQRCACTWKSRG